MQAALEVRAARAEILAVNVANADTPGYVAQDLNFKNMLGQLLDSNDASVTPSETLARENLRADGNDVDLNQELGKAYENSLSYVATLKLYGDSNSRTIEATSST